MSTTKKSSTPSEHGCGKRATVVTAPASVISEACLPESIHLSLNQASLAIRNLLDGNIQDLRAHNTTYNGTQDSPCFAQSKVPEVWSESGLGVLTPATRTTDDIDDTSTELGCDDKETATIPLQPMRFNKFGQRVDPSIKCDRKVMDHLKSRRVCKNYFLRECSFNNCRFNHDEMLTAMELQNLQVYARGTPCNSISCNDPHCIDGHQCRYNWTCTNPRCSFPPNMHEVDTEVVETKNPEEKNPKVARGVGCWW